MARTCLFALLWGCLFSCNSFARGGNGNGVAGGREKLTSLAVESLTLPQLTTVDSELADLWGQLNAARKAESDTAAEIPLLQAYAQYETQEAVGAVQSRLAAELRKGEAKISLPIVEKCLDVLTEIMTALPVQQIDDLISMAKIAAKQFTKPDGKALLAYFDFVIDRAKQRKFKLASVRERLEALLNTPSELRATLDRMQRRLQSRIRGQPEIVQAFMDLEWANQMYKNARLLPDYVFLMGQGGTGKDTSAEAFTDALWDMQGAYEEHMFRLPIMKGKPEFWQALGSSTGFVGSENLPPFILFLLQHSGGRYLLKTIQPEGGGKPSYSVIENPLWKGSNLPGYWTPDKAVVFANELHNWSKDNKDLLLKQALEKGYFPINNPNGGIAQIYVPVRFVMASNDGIGLVTSREANGQRHGKPLSYEQSLPKWEDIHDDKDALKSEILAGNGSVNNKNVGEDALGTSEEFLDRLQPDRYILLMRPHSPETLKLIAADRMTDMRNRLALESGFFKSVDLTWDGAIVDMIQGYDYMAENNARQIKGNVETLIQDTLLHAVRDGDLPVSDEKKNVAIHLSLQQNDDQTVDLVIDYTEAGQEPRQVHKLIQRTEKDRPTPALTDAQIQRLGMLAENLKRRVFGIDLIADRIADRILAIENQRTADSEESRRVSTIVALGLSSTGKTELAKALAAELLGDESELVTFDFSQIQTLHDFKTRILGLRDAGGPIKSDFMKAYDRANGKLFVAFDELANVRDPALLTALYDFFREPVISTFSDGIPRKMGGVMVLVTGNAGQEEYQNVPSHIPMEQQMMAWEDISKQIALDSALQRRILERYFPGPLITRWSKNNVFFFPPHTFKSLRQLAQLKLDKELKRLANTKSRRGWNVVVPSAEEYRRLIDAIVEEGFSLRYQGASIDSFILEDLGEALESLLLKNLVPSGSTVVLQFTGKTANDNADQPGAVLFNVFVDGAAEPLKFMFKRPYIAKPLIENPEEQKITAFHEAGHSIMRQVFFADISRPGLISITPGVTQINDEWVLYAGIAQWEEVGTPHPDRDYVVRLISVLAAGEMAERLVTQGESHTMGKSNDMKRATKLAQDAILRFGLSEAWGTHAIPDGTSLPEYLASLSEAQKQLLERERQKLISEGQELARQYLQANFANALIPLGNLLIEKGLVPQEEMAGFYQRVPLIRQLSKTPFAPVAKILNWVSRVGRTPATGPGLLRPDITTPRSVANIASLAEARKLKQFKEVPPPAVLPVGTNAAYAASLGTARPGPPAPCEKLLKVANK